MKGDVADCAKYHRSSSECAIIYLSNDKPAERQTDPTRYLLADAADYNYCYYEEYKKLYAASFMLSTQVTHPRNADEGAPQNQGRTHKQTEQAGGMRLPNIRRKQKTSWRSSRTATPKIRKNGIGGPQSRSRGTSAALSRSARSCTGESLSLLSSEGSLLQHIKLKHPEVYALDPHQSHSEEDDEDEANS